ncbi:MAG: UDP-N-acetylmuramate--L-alanine ligase [Candidatus Omnitrophica bacterium]|nr:UDP-N-acetylmuramate--L-alanine ligase [Candidatus Omnitrophota bacterium]MDD5610030.1 UDP-N-acetylmuramate--L-alanine ligase [Candidatus Omnitrophota bacterium]
MQDKKENKNIYFIGIGGIGMSGIALILLKKGYVVEGSDVKDSNIINQLRRAGAKIYIGHNAENLKEGTNIVVYSSAIKEDNPELKEARRRHLTVMRRAESLARLMEDKTVITVTGAHGKTTTTSLASYLLFKANLNPTVAVGGILRNLDNNALLGSGKFFVAEADESDGSFLHYKPDYSIITNIDYEHMDFYKDWPNLISTYRKFINNTKESGMVFCCGDDINLKDILKTCKNKHLLFGLTKDSDIHPKDIKMRDWLTEYECIYKNKSLGKFSLPLMGTHNVSNSLAVIGLGMELDLDLKVIKETLSTFKGSERRLQIKLEQDGILVVDDYAHHPTEIRAVLNAIRNLNNRRIVTIFQPHRYSRTKLLMDEFATCFDLSDYNIITDIYPASEEPIEGISGRSIYEKVKQSGHKETHFLPKEEIVDYVCKILKPQDLVITLGAGDIYKVNNDLVSKLKKAP